MNPSHPSSQVSETPGSGKPPAADPARPPEQNADGAGKGGDSGPADRASGRGFRRFLLFPFLILLAAFVLDKQPFLWRYPDYFLRTASFLSYDHKEKMLTDLEQYMQFPGRKKVLVVFGNSRTYGLDPQRIEAQHPDWILFNFSVPGGTPDYFAYMMERFRERNIRPDYIFFTVTPQGFNARSALAMDEVMLNGLPVSFVAANFTNFHVDELTNYAAKTLFWTYQYKLSYAAFKHRIRNHRYELYRFRVFQARSLVEMEENRGSTPRGLDFDPPQDPDLLREQAEDIYRNFLRGFRIKAGMRNFSEDMLEHAEALGSPRGLLWAKVGPELRSIMAERKVEGPDGKERTILEAFRPAMQDLAREHDALFLDMNYTDAIACDKYYDTSHLAGICMHEFSDYLMAEMLERGLRQADAEASL